MATRLLFCALLLQEVHALRFDVAWRADRRHTCLTLGASALACATLPPRTASAASVPTAEDLERMQLERRDRIAKGRTKFDSLVKSVERSTSPLEFEEAADALSLSVIGEGIPEGVNLKETVNRVRLAYAEFNDPCPTTVVKCPNPRSKRAENAYGAFLGVLREAAPKNAGASGSNGALRGF
mmetsp:Transcript_5106/g.11242  ORF Transcript_5106/g.11242 Transcript_5106/m.11242 type:complete len:182 (-) Transcript_5106:144-689(-)